MEKIEDLIFSGNFMYPDLVDAMKYEVYVNDSRSKIHSASQDPNFTKEMRECGISWIPTGKNLVIERVLDGIVKEANLVKGWNIPLSKWQCDIQYTYYYQPQDHYDWHVDVLRNCPADQNRRLSIVFCLSSANDYEGADLQFKYNKHISSIKLDCGDFVVFPSNIYHRVTKLISGERETLVGWYQ